MTKEYKPEWAKNLEDWGKRMEDRYGSKSSSRPCSNDNGGCKGSDPAQGPTLQDKPSWKKNFSPLGDIFGQLISYFVVTYAPAYFPNFFLEGWSAVYIVIIFSIIIHVAVDLILILLQYRPFYYLGQVIRDIAGVISMVVMVTIFPFNFPGNIGAIVQFALWIAIVIVAICIIFDFLKIFIPEKDFK